MPDQASAAVPAKTAATPTSADLLGRFLVKHDLVIESQLHYARRIQKKLATPKTLLQVLRELRYVDEALLRTALRKDHVGMRIGDLLVELVYLRDKDLQTALAKQKVSQDAKKLGEILVEGGFIDEQKFIQVLSYQMGIPLAALSSADLDRELIGRAPSKWYSMTLAACSCSRFSPKWPAATTCANSANP